MGTETAVNFVPALNLAATSVTANPTTVVANGVSTAQATVTFRDFADNNIEVDELKIKILVKGAEMPATYHGKGIFEITVPARTTPEIVPITVSYNGVLITSSANVTFEPRVNLAATEVTVLPTPGLMPTARAQPPRRYNLKITPATIYQ